MQANGNSGEGTNTVWMKLQSKVSSIICSARRAGSLWKCIYRYGLERALWVLGYVEETLGGHESFSRKLPFDRNISPLPWYTYPAIEYIRQFDFSGCRVFEYGSGNSSRFWAQRASTVTSVESHPDWYRSGIRELLPNQTLLLRTEKQEYVNTIHDGNNLFDIIVIDGVYRFNCATQAVGRIRTGGFIILDNSDWFPGTARFLRDSGFTQVDFIGAGPVNSYAWCTSLFFRGQINVSRISDSEAIRVSGGLVEISEADKLL